MVPNDGVVIRLGRAGEGKRQVGRDLVGDVVDLSPALVREGDVELVDEHPPRRGVLDAVHQLPEEPERGGDDASGGAAVHPLGQHVDA